jgi:hypothetical protein
MLLSPSGCAFAAAGQVGYAQQIGFLYLFGTCLFLVLLGFAFTSCFVSFTFVIISLLSPAFLCHICLLTRALLRIQ